MISANIGGVILQGISDISKSKTNDSIYYNLAANKENCLIGFFRINSHDGNVYEVEWVMFKDVYMSSQLVSAFELGKKLAEDVLVGKITPNMQHLITEEEPSKDDFVRIWSNAIDNYINGIHINDDSMKNILCAYWSLVDNIEKLDDIKEKNTGKEEDSEKESENISKANDFILNSYMRIGFLAYRGLLGRIFFRYAFNKIFSGLNYIYNGNIDFEPDITQFYYPYYETKIKEWSSYKYSSKYENNYRYRLLDYASSDISISELEKSLMNSRNVQ